MLLSGLTSLLVLPPLGDRLDLLLEELGTLLSAPSAPLCSPLNGLD